MEATLDKRIRRTTQHKKELAYIASRHIGAALYAAYCKSYQHKGSDWDPALYEQCRVENERVHLSKPLPTLKQNADRSDPDWPIEKVRLFMKNQSVTKAGALNRDAKPGQIIASFRAQVILTLGPIGRYLAHRIFDQLPENIYVHHRRRTEDLAAFAAKHWDYSQISLEADAQAFDQSNGPDVLHCETLFMRAHNVPQHLIDYYLELKRTARTFLGPLEFMRLTGEVFTLLFNTVAMMAYLALKYDPPTNVARLHTGDDVALNAQLPINPKFAHLLRRIRITTVDTYTTTPTFVGWRLTPGGLLKDPALLLARTLYSKSRGNFDKTCVAYYHDLLVGLKAWPSILPHVSTDEAAMVHELCQIFHTQARIYPPLRAAMLATGYTPTAVRDF